MAIPNSSVFVKGGVITGGKGLFRLRYFLRIFKVQGGGGGDFRRFCYNNKTNLGLLFPEKKKNSDPFPFPNLPVQLGMSDNVT